MPDSTARRADAELQAYNWARVAGGWKIAVRERDAAREISNADPGDLTEWQWWLLDHLTDSDMDVHQAIGLAEMWVRVATVQDSDG
jgi:hypothetical protein